MKMKQTYIDLMNKELEETNLSVEKVDIDEKDEKLAHDPPRQEAGVTESHSPLGKVTKNDIMNKLHKSSINDNNLPSKEGERGLLCSNKMSFRSPSLVSCGNDSYGDSILVSEIVIVRLFFLRISTQKREDTRASDSGDVYRNILDDVTNEKPKTVVSVEEYRRVTDDNISTDERIIERLQYLEALCRNIIKAEIQKL